MPLHAILSWWNLIFVAPFLVALLYLGLYTLSGITFGDPDVASDFDADADGDFHLGGDADAGAAIDHDVDLDHDLELDHDVALDHDVDADADADAEAETHAEAPSATGSGAMAALHWLGVGRVPVSILLMVLLMTWGAAGFIANAILDTAFPGARAALISVPFAMICSIAMTRLLVGAMVRWLPTYETTARRRHELLGSIGEAIFPIDERFGMAGVRDDQGDFYQVPCRVVAGTATIAKRQQVKLIAYNARLGIFSVAPAGAPVVKSS